MSAVKYYYKAKIDGIWYHVDVYDTSYFDEPYAVIPGWGKLGNPDKDTMTLFSTVGWNWNQPSGSTSLTVQKNSFYHINSMTPESFEAYLAPGVYPLLPDTAEIIDGILLSWIGPDDKVYSATHELADQIDSHFEIVSTTANTRHGMPGLMVKMRFNCDLYQLSNGQRKRLTEGEMVTFFARPQ